MHTQHTHTHILTHTHTDITRAVQTQAKHTTTQAERFEGYFGPLIIPVYTYIFFIILGERPFKCEECMKDFTQKRSLINHMRTHTGERPYACSVCDKTFVQKRNMINHVRNLHTGERPYVCEECGIDFSTKRSLLKHATSHVKKEHEDINGGNNADENSKVGTSNGETSTSNSLVTTIKMEENEMNFEETVAEEMADDGKVGEESAGEESASEDNGNKSDSEISFTSTSSERSEDISIEICTQEGSSSKSGIVDSIVDVETDEMNVHLKV